MQWTQIIYAWAFIVRLLGWEEGYTIYKVLLGTVAISVMVISGDYNYLGLFLYYKGYQTYIRRRSILQTLHKHIYAFHRLISSAQRVSLRVAANPALEKAYGHQLRYTRYLLAAAKKGDSDIGKLVAYLQKLPPRRFSYFFSPLGYLLAAYELLKREKEALADLIYEMGAVDAQLSIATFFEEQKQREPNSITFGEIVAHKEDTAPLMRICDLYHPMLAFEKAIKNDVTMGDGSQPNRFAIITGANRAGKSTYILATGVNVILFQRFYWSFAQTHRQTLFQKVVTYVRPTQNIALGLSLGEAGMEVLKVHDQALRRVQGPVLIISDEVFTGTEVKVATDTSSRILVKWYQKYPHLLLFLTTHLRGLTALANHHDGIVNKKVFVDVPGRDGKPFDTTYKVGKGIGTDDIVEDMLKEKGIL